MANKDQEKGLCLFLAPFGGEGDPIRERAKGIRDEILKPALGEEYEIEWSLDDRRPGDLSELILELIEKADFVVADLTGLNPNVMYELALAHGLQKKVVTLSEDTSNLPFHVTKENTILFRSTLAGRRAAVSSLKSAANSVQAEPLAGNPITRAMTRKILSERLTKLSDEMPGKGEGEDWKVFLIPMFEEIHDIKRNVARLARSGGARTQGSSSPSLPSGVNIDWQDPFDEEEYNIKVGPTASLELGVPEFHIFFTRIRDGAVFWTVREGRFEDVMFKDDELSALLNRAQRYHESS